MFKKTIKSICILMVSGCLLMGCTNTNSTSATPNQETPSAQEETPVTETQDQNTESTVEDETTDPDDEATDGSTSALDNLISEKNQGMDDLYGDYKEVGGAIAYVTSVSQIDDTNYNTAVYDGIKTYATGAGVSYSYYIPDQDSEESYRKTIMKALENNAILVVTSGAHFDTLIGSLQDEYPEVSFLMIDGIPRDTDGNAITISPNVHCVEFKEQEAGYLAGYMVTLEGYTKLGFIGGEDIAEVESFGYGFLQGINDASVSLGNTKDIEVNYWYSGTFLPNDTILQTASDWYGNDETEVIFSCGGAIYESILSAANKYDTKMIGVDIDQGSISDRIITSAMKGVDRAVVIALDDYFAFNGWSEDMAGQLTEYGINEKCSCLPTMDWRFTRATLEDYDSLHGLIKSGLITISDSPEITDELAIQIHYYTSPEE